VSFIIEHSLGLDVSYIYPNPNSYANPNPNPNPAMSDCYVQACRICLLAGSCNGTVSRVRVSIKTIVRDRCAKELMWYGCSVPTAE